MTSIPSLLYIILGLGISIASYVINRSAQSNSLVLFLYIGVVFTLIGIIKLVWGKKQEKPAPHAARMASTGQQAAQQAAPMVQAGHAHQAPIQHPLPQRPLVTTPVANQFPPPNKIEKLIFEQERTQAQAQMRAPAYQASHPAHTAHAQNPHPVHAAHAAQGAHPPIIHCANCGRRQYATKPNCFSCGKTL